jgi:hypothetical protein
MWEEDIPPAETPSMIKISQIYSRPEVPKWWVAAQKWVAGP